MASRTSTSTSAATKTVASKTAPTKKAPTNKASTKKASTSKTGTTAKASSTRTASTKTASTTSAATTSTSKKAASTKSGTATAPVLLAGGNPQIAKGDGHAPVQAYLAAMPGWKRDIGRHLDELIVRTVPDVHKAVKWNSPFYGVEGQGWFLNFHCFTKYVKVAFFRGTSLRPPPPGTSKSKDVRYLDIHEHDEIDDGQLADWIRQASELPGEVM